MAAALVLGSASATPNTRAERDRSNDASSTRVAEATKDSDGYTAALSVNTSYVAGQKGTFTVKLTPKEGFHINPQFPIRFKPVPVDGITYTKEVLKREDGNITETDGTFTVEFSAAKPGATSVGGTLSLSVCSEKNCLMEKVALDSPITVTAQ